MRIFITRISSALAGFVVLAAASTSDYSAVGSSAWAKSRPMSFMSSAQLKQACGKSGGHFAINDAGNFWACSKECTSKSGKKDLCAVECNGDSKTCEGNTPDRQANGFIQQILRAGAFSDRRNVKTMTNNSGNFAQPSAGTRMITNSGTFQARQPPAVGVPTAGVPSLAMPGRPAPSQGTLNMQKR